MNKFACAVADVVAVLAFAWLGTRSHTESARSVLVVAWPFLVGLAVGWLIQIRRPDAAAPAFGAVIWVTTWALGMAIRHWVAHDGTAASFMVVAAAFLAVLLLGWRGLGVLVRRRAARQPG